MFSDAGISIFIPQYDLVILDPQCLLIECSRNDDLKKISEFAQQWLKIPHTMLQSEGKKAGEGPSKIGLLCITKNEASTKTAAAFFYGLKFSALVYNDKGQIKQESSFLSAYLSTLAPNCQVTKLTAKDHPFIGIRIDTTEFDVSKIHHFVLTRFPEISFQIHQDKVRNRHIVYGWGTNNDLIDNIVQIVTDLKSYFFVIQVNIDDKRFQKQKIEMNAPPKKEVTKKANLFEFYLNDGDGIKDFMTVVKYGLNSHIRPIICLNKLGSKSQDEILGFTNVPRPESAAGAGAGAGPGRDNNSDDKKG